MMDPHAPNPNPLASLELVYRASKGYVRPCYEFYGDHEPAGEGNGLDADSSNWIGSIDALASQHLSEGEKGETEDGPLPFVTLYEGSGQ
jgi:hypothetical protein